MQKIVVKNGQRYIRTYIDFVDAFRDPKKFFAHDLDWCCKFIKEVTSQMWNYLNQLRYAQKFNSTDRLNYGILSTNEVFYIFSIFLIYKLKGDLYFLYWTIFIIHFLYSNYTFFIYTSNEMKVFNHNVKHSEIKN